MSAAQTIINEQLRAENAALVAERDRLANEITILAGAYEIVEVQRDRLRAAFKHPAETDEQFDARVDLLVPVRWLAGEAG